MDIKVFLNKCKATSKLCNSVAGKYGLKKDNIVYFDSIPYYPVGYKMTFDNYGKAIHTAILHDINAKSVIDVRLESVEEFNE